MLEQFHPLVYLPNRAAQIPRAAPTWGGSSTTTPDLVLTTGAATYFSGTVLSSDVPPLQEPSRKNIAFYVAVPSAVAGAADCLGTFSAVVWGCVEYSSSSKTGIAWVKLASYTDKPLGQLFRLDVWMPLYFQVTSINITSGTPSNTAAVIGAMAEDYVNSDLAASGATSAVTVTLGGSTSGQSDAFGRLRVSEPVTQFDGKMLYDTSPLDFDGITTGGASFSALGTTSMLGMNVTLANDKCVRQTRRYMPYQPGKSLLNFITFNLFPGAADSNNGLRRRVGYFDDNVDKTYAGAAPGGNGYFLETNGYPTLSGYTVSFVRRSYVTGSQVDTPVLQASWNLDPMDGTGPSGLVLDLRKANILIIDQEWLGVGAVRMGFVIDGAIYYCHVFKNANLLTTMHTQTASLPVRYEIAEKNGVATTGTMNQGCSTVVSEGGHNPRGRVFAYGNPTGLAVALNTWRPVISIRPRPAQGRVSLVPLGVEVLLEGVNDVVEYQLVKGIPTIAPVTFVAAAFADYAASYSGAQRDTAATGATGGVVVGGGYIARTQRVSTENLAEELIIASDIRGEPETLTVLMQGIGGGATARCRLHWREVY